MPKNMINNKRTRLYAELEKEGYESQQDKDRQLVLAIKYMVEKYNKRIPANLSNEDLILQYQELSKISNAIPNPEVKIELVKKVDEQDNDAQNSKRVNRDITINPDGSKEYRGFEVLDKEDFKEFDDKKKSRVKKDTEKKKQTQDKPQVKVSI